MSHFTRIEVEITDRTHLVEALSAMGYDVSEHDTVRGWDGQQTTAELVVRRENGYDIGFRPTGSGWEVVADWMGVDDTPASFGRKLRQEYAAQATMARMRANPDFREVRRTRTEEGDIEITAVPAR